MALKMFTLKNVNLSMNFPKCVNILILICVVTISRTTGSGNALISVRQASLIQLYSRLIDKGDRSLLQWNLLATCSSPRYSSL